MVQKLIENNPTKSIIAAFLISNLLGIITTVACIGYFAGKVDQRISNIEQWKDGRTGAKIPERLSTVEKSQENIQITVNCIKNDVEDIKKGLWKHLGEKDKPFP